MSSKVSWHINPDGDPRPCTARVQCPFGTPEQHFSTADEARRHFEVQHNSIPKTKSRKHNFTPLQEQDSFKKRWLSPRAAKEVQDYSYVLCTKKDCRTNSHDLRSTSNTAYRCLEALPEGSPERKKMMEGIGRAKKAFIEDVKEYSADLVKLSAKINADFYIQSRFRKDYPHELETHNMLLKRLATYQKEAPNSKTIQSLDYSHYNKVYSIYTKILQEKNQKDTDQSNEAAHETARVKASLSNKNRKPKYSPPLKNPSYIERDPARMKLGDLVREIDHERRNPIISEEVEIVPKPGVRGFFGGVEERIVRKEYPTERAVQLNNFILSLSPQAKEAYNVYIEAQHVKASPEILKKAEDAFAVIRKDEDWEDAHQEKRLKDTVDDYFKTRLDSAVGTVDSPLNL